MTSHGAPRAALCAFQGFAGWSFDVMASGELAEGGSAASWDLTDLGVLDETVSLWVGELSVHFEKSAMRDLFLDVYSCIAARNYGFRSSQSAHPWRSLSLNSFQRWGGPER